MIGAQWRPDRGKWMAHISIQGEETFLGYYDTEAEAHQAWAQARGQHPRSRRNAARANQRRYEEAEARQMERCEAILAEEEERKRPERTRCDCGGILHREHLPEHHCPYFHPRAA